ncbi:MAG: histidine phosphatase family protein [Candidatus Nanoarchaeia archaeon]|nr:histidine phosphatase family protein [Candidatus Nanoarchaeia archaeon]
MVYRYIYIFRHGKTYYNTFHKFTGWKDSRLTIEGVRQAKKIAEQLKNKKINVAFQTTLKRSKQTLKYVLRGHPECKKIITDDRIIERSYGRLEGKTHKNFIEKEGSDDYKTLLRWHKIDHLQGAEKEKFIHAIGQAEFDLVHRSWKVRPSGGESFSDVETRVKPFINDLTKYIKKNKVNVAISAHGNSIRLFRKIMEKSSIRDTCSWFIPYDKVFTYKIKV